MDGSGKSTHARCLAERLSARGHSARYVYAGGYMVLGPVAWLFRQLTIWLLPTAEKPGSVNHENPLLRPGRKPAPFRLWPVLALIDRLFHFFLVLRPALFFGDVICDRYFYDMLIGFRFHGYMGASFENVARRLMPRPDVILVLEVDPAVARLRETNGNHNLSFYLEFHKRYRDLAVAIGAHVVDTSESKAQTIEEIARLVGEFQVSN